MKKLLPTLFVIAGIILGAALFQQQRSLGAFAPISVPAGGTGFSSTSINSLIVTGSTATSTLRATSSPTVGYITATSTTATSTFANGINILGGCLRVGGSCLSTTIAPSIDWQKESNFGVLTLTASTSIPYWAKQSIYASSTLITSDRVGIATSTSDRMLSVQGNALFSGDLTLANITASGTATTTNIRISDTLTIGGDNITELVGTGLTLSGSTLTTSLGTSIDLGSAEVTGTLLIANGGTGQTSFTGGQLLYGNSTAALSSVATSSLSNGGGLVFSASAGALVGGSNLTITARVSTSSVPTRGRVAYWTGNGTPSELGDVATTSVSCTGNTTCTSFTVIGGSPIVIDSTGGAGTGNVSTSTNETSGNLAYWTSNSATPATLGLIATSSLAVGASLTTTGTLGSQVGGSALTISLNLGNANSWTALQTFTNASTTNISSTQGVQLATSGGQVGIGTTTSSNSLSVQGNALISGNLTSVANITATGTVGIGTTSPPTLGVQGNSLVSGTSTVGSLNVASSSVTLNGVSYVLPADDGTADQRLTTNGSGVLSWATGGGTVNWQQLGSTTMATAANTLTASWTGEHQDIECMIQLTAPAANSQARVTFNSDNGPNYGSKANTNNGAYTTEDTSTKIALQPGNSTLGQFYKLFIINRNGTNKVLRWVGYIFNTTANNVGTFIDGAGQFGNSTTSITSVTLLLDSGTALGVGSRVSCYGSDF